MRCILFDVPEKGNSGEGHFCRLADGVGAGIKNVLHVPVSVVVYSATCVFEADFVEDCAYLHLLHFCFTKRLHFGYKKKRPPRAFL